MRLLLSQARHQSFKYTRPNCPSGSLFQFKRSIGTYNKMSTSIKEHIIDKAFLNFRGRLSEGPTYNPSNNSFLWVDIIAGELHRVFLEKSQGKEYTTEELTKITESHQVFTAGGDEEENFGVVFLTQDDDVVLVGARKGIASLNLQTKEFKYKTFYEPKNDKLRSNDGNIDPLGNIWVGLMGDFHNGPFDGGKLIKIDKSSGDAISTEVPNVLIPNGINWSKDGKTLYWTSSLEFIIYKFDYDMTTGTVSNKQPFIKIKEFFLPEDQIESPEPDGFTLTQSGDLYTAVFSSSSILHFNPQGQLVEKFKFPAQRITSVVFGGVDMDEMFVTSANLHLDDPSKLDQCGDDLGGSIFRVKVDGVQGILKPKYQA